ncbi:hypothetical protein KUTeg_013414 [Tegillarca granosa]|uniref:Uncharacterized protein n=1 Tax=Tegillarca granosa TaxID=220873 RepID=A0ABQ9ETQ0_TEGGR|nr:hypothetical protein KUTeg_013414 [Tegillarca granosa]
MVKNAQDAIHKYFETLPKPAIKYKPKDPNLHLQLGLVLEERYYSEDIFGLKKEEGGEALPSFNFEAKESSKSEECDAICKLRGVDASTAPIALQLKAIDEEYHHLVNSGQSGKADHVMKLFVWKSKQASQEGAAAQKAADEESPLGQAYLKMMDALVLDEAKALYNFHVGRLLMVQGNYDDAVKRLEVTLGWNPAHQLARSYLGLALALQKTGPGARSKETIGYLLEAMEILLTELSKSSMSDADPSAVNPILYGDDLIRSTNVHLLRGIVQLGRLLQRNPDSKDCITAKDVFHISALLASQVLPRICKGDTYKQIEWILLDSHSNLLEMLSSNQSGNEKIIAQRCERLSALIFHSTIPMNDQLLALQETTCQKLVQIQPCNSHSLYLLGAAQFSKFENSPPGDAANKLLQDVKSSFGASISLEGKPAAGELPDSVKEQEWFQQKIKQEEEKKKAQEAKQAATAKPAAAGAKGAPAARGGPAARGAPAARGRGAPAAKAAPAVRGGARGGTQAARGGAAKAPAGKAAPAAGKAAAPQSKPHVCEPTPPPADKKPEAEPAKPAKPAEEPKQEQPSNAPINRKTYHPRLGLARAHKAANEIEESQKYYNEVIVMAPEVHDAYIELAEMLAKSNPAAAVEIYSKFPISDPPTFDDAYIIGEIVRLLMKAESYGDPKLEKYMILYGRVLGLPVLEKYVKILEDKFKTDLLKKVYAGVNMKAVDDPDLEAFFKFKCWI